MDKKLSPAMQILEKTLDCLVSAINITNDANGPAVHIGFIRPEGGSIVIKISTTPDAVLNVTEEKSNG